MFGSLSKGSFSSLVTFQWLSKNNSFSLELEQIWYRQSEVTRVILFPKRQILDSSKLKESAYDNLKIHESGRNVSKQVENTAVKGEIARYEQFLLFPQCFKKTLYYRHIKTRACLGKS